MVSEAEAQKSPTQRFTDKFERIFVPAVLALTVALLFAWVVVDEPFRDSFYRAMAVLVAASPCALAIATRQREPLLPNVPTFAEAGVPDFNVSTWYGLFAPKATPDEPLDALHAAVQAALGEGDVKRIWQEQGARVDLESRKAFAEFVAREVERWTAVAKTTGLPME